MKSNIGKYIFAIIVICLIIFAIYILYVKEENNSGQANNNEIKKEEIQMLTNLRLSVVNFDTINPILSKNKNIQDISRLIYEPLLNINKEYKVELCLAKEWSKISETSYIIKLKEDVKWQDNTPFTSKDVQYTIDRLKDSTVSSIYTLNVKDVSSVELVDEHTIKINLNKEVPFFEYNLNFPIIASHYYINQDFVNSPKNNNPVGTGRYKVSENGVGSIILKQNQNWWNLDKEKTKIDIIQVNKYTSMGEVYNAFKIGNIDLIHTSSINVEEYIGTIGFNTKDYKSRELDYLTFNLNNNILSKLEVRQAINYAIDKQNIVGAVYNNKYFVSNFPLDFGSYIYPKDRITSEYNQDKAKSILVNSGWEYKNKAWQKIEDYKTQKIKLDLIVKSSNEKRVEVAQIIVSQLEEIGIKVNLIKATDAQYQNYLKNKNYDMILTGIYSSYSPDLTTYFGKENLANFNNEEINLIMKQINNISDEKLLKEKYDRIYQIYSEQIPYVGLYYGRNTVIYSQNLIGDIQPNAYSIFNNIDSWYRQ